eukprot:CAMPEP_0115014178 /NCGR_PEP_ID=MMETSP0216-20121206/25901_1 /TAXON_ID=223996 /ORGANISM="Protocruzia adherens, Strain Boccale" /LENGTH=763 /DNA_ID=CAMNT_0002383823 /DNA_START=71 /DNA_END=2362 /DNA_ORIENTATION=-
MEELYAILFIFGSVFLGILYAVINVGIIHRIKITDDDAEGNKQSLKSNELLVKISDKIAECSDSFLKQEYAIMGIFIVSFGLVLFFLVDQVNDGLGSFWVTASFTAGALTSMLSGYIGMKVAVVANSRTAVQSQYSAHKGFLVAFRAGAVLGFGLCSLGLGVLMCLLLIYKALRIDGEATDAELVDQYTKMFDALAGYGLGGSSIALFARVGGGIYTKCADVGADLVGKVENDLDEDNIKNAATIADNVGDNVGDVAGMGADLFGSFAESTCACLVVSATSTRIVTESGAIYFPLAISAAGIIVCLLTSFLATHVQTVKDKEQDPNANTATEVETILKWQLGVSTILMTVALYGLAFSFLPDEFTIGNEGDLIPATASSPIYAFASAVSGLWSGLIIGYFTEFYTSHSHTPVREVSHACSTGAATNIIYGLALGYISCIIPTICMAITVYISFKFAGMYGIALGALGILSILAICLTIDGYGPVSDNAGGIAEMAELGEDVREKTDALDAAGNTTAAIGKGFAIGSAALVALALFGAFVTRCQNSEQKVLQNISLLEPLLFAGLIIGAMLPYAFSAMTMKAVGTAALEMVEFVREDIRSKPGMLDPNSPLMPDYDGCIRIATKASLKQMVGPGCLVMITPIVFGIFLGPETLSGLLAGAIVSGVQMATSAANTGGAWDNAKKYIEAGLMTDKDGNVLGKGTNEHKAAVTGDTVGDPLKDTSGPSLNILVKLMSIISLVFAGVFASKWATDMRASYGIVPTTAA